jgi:RNA polymerase sigma factor (sigma-70 family)
VKTIQLLLADSLSVNEVCSTLVSADPDVRLLQAWRAGDERAGSLLYHRHAAAVERFFRNKVDERDLADLIQETFLACFKHGEGFRGDSSFRTYILGFARNFLLHHYRTHYRKHDKIDFGVSSVIDLGVTPLGLVVDREQAKHLLAALRGLAVEQQILLELHYWEGMNGGELAQFYGVPEGTIRTRLRRARQLLVARFEACANVSTGSTTLTTLETWAREIREYHAAQAPSLG